MYFDEFPAEYLQAKLRLINSRISELPDVRVGKREGRDVLRQIKIINGKRIVREVSPNKQAGKDLLVRSEYRNKLLTVKRQIEASLKGVPVAGEIDVRKVNTLYDRKFWEQIHIRAEFEKKEKGYDYKGMILDSRAEMIVAQCLDSMGLSYKYEPRIIIGGEIYYPDFIVYLPEFQRCFFIEFLGKLNDLKYITRNEFKLMDYLNSGMIVNLDLLLFCGFEDRMVNADDMKDDIMALIRKYCRLYRA